MLARTSEPWRSSRLAALSIAGFIAVLLAAGVVSTDALEHSRQAAVGRAVEMATPALAGWITAQRDALAPAAAPPPPAMVALLSGYFSTSMLSSVRYRVGWPESVAGVGLWLADARAITVDHIIVFRDVRLAADPVLWAHELTHVRQFERWGARAFARQYLENRDAVETEAWTAAADYKMWAIAAGQL
ncbi:MAG: DUF4157 domain-containing protein [Rhodospirillales bacterium]